MNKTLINRRYVADNVLTFVQTHGEVFKDDPQYQTLRLELEQRVEELRSMQTDLEILRMPLSKRKEQIKSSYVRRLDKLGKLVKQHAMANQLDQPLQFIANVKTRLSRGTILQSLTAAQELVELAESLRTELELMSRGKLTLDEAKESFEEFSNIALRPARRVKEASNRYSYFKKKLSQCIKFIRMDVTTFFYSWEAEYPEQYNLFLSYADTPDFGRRYEEVEEESPPVDDFTSNDEVEV